MAAICDNPYATVPHQRLQLPSRHTLEHPPQHRQSYRELLARLHIQRAEQPHRRMRLARPEGRVLPAADGVRNRILSEHADGARGYDTMRRVVIGNVFEETNASSRLHTGTRPSAFAIGMLR